MSCTYYVPGRAAPPPRLVVRRVPDRAPAPPAPPVPSAPATAAVAYHVPGAAPRPRAVSPTRLRLLETRYPEAGRDVLTLLSMYPEEAADPVTLGQLAQLAGEPLAALLRRRHPSTIAGPPPERGPEPRWRTPRREPGVADLAAADRPPF